MRWLALVLLIGCGDNLPGITLEERQAAETAARCARLTRCGLYQTESECVAATRTRVQALLIAAVDAGVVVYHPTLEQVCVEEMKQLSCDVTSRDSRVIPGTCQGAISGTRAPGAACRFDDECTTGRCAEAICEPYECCEGMCMPDRKSAGACSSNEDCVETSYCSPDHECAPLVAELGDCSNDSACGFGLACIGASSVQTGTCRKLPHIGERCPYGRCAELGARCDATGTCVAFGLPGSTCSADAECSPFAVCEVTASRCTSLPKLGDACTQRCAGDSYCSASSAICSPPLENNAQCRTSSDCQSGLCAEGPIFYQCVTLPLCL